MGYGVACVSVQIYISVLLNLYNSTLCIVADIGRVDKAVTL